MKILIVLLYLIGTGYFFYSENYIIAGIMTAFGIAFILYLPIHIKNQAKAVKQKIIKAAQDKKEGKEIKPFIDVNKVPWQVLAELPGISEGAAKHAVEMRRQGGPFPSKELFIKVVNIKEIFAETIKDYIYTKYDKK